MDEKPYTAQVFVHSHAETGKYIGCDVLEVAGGWVGDWLLEELQSDLNESTGLFDDLEHLDLAYNIDFSYTRYPGDGDEVIGPITEFEYDEPVLAQMPPWILIDHDTLQIIYGYIITGKLSVDQDRFDEVLDLDRRAA